MSWSAKTKFLKGIFRSWGSGEQCRVRDWLCSCFPAKLLNYGFTAILGTCTLCFTCWELSSYAQPGWPLTPAEFSCVALSLTQTYVPAALETLQLCFYGSVLELKTLKHAPSSGVSFLQSTVNLWSGWTHLHVVEGWQFVEFDLLLLTRLLFS